MRVMVGMLGMVWAMAAVAAADPLAPLRANPQLCAAEQDWSARERCLQKAGVTSFSRKGQRLSVPLATGKVVQFVDNLSDSDAYARYSYYGFDFQLQRHILAYAGYEWESFQLVDVRTGQTIDAGDQYRVSPDGRWLAQTDSTQGQFSLGLIDLTQPTREPLWPPLNEAVFVEDCVPRWRSNSEVRFECRSAGEKPKAIGGQAVLQAGRWYFSGPVFAAAPVLPALAASSGMKITGVRPLSPAALAGIEPGWFLLSLNGEPIHAVDDARRVNAAASQQRITAELGRGEQKRVVFIPPHTGTLGLDLCLPEKCR